MIISVVGRRGQLTLPREIRRNIHIEDGDRVAFVIEGNRVILQPLTQTLADLRGSIPVSGPQDFAAIRQQVIATRAGKAARNEG